MLDAGVQCLLGTMGSGVVPALEELAISICPLISRCQTLSTPGKLPGEAGRTRGLEPTVPEACLGSNELWDGLWARGFRLLSPDFLDCEMGPVAGLTSPNCKDS